MSSIDDITFMQIFDYSSHFIFTYSQTYPYMQV